jgi:predicted transcriptional regulator
MAQNQAGSAQKLTQDIMTSKVICLKGDMTVRDSIKLLIDNKISGAPVVDGTLSILSVVTQGDLLRLAALQGLDTLLGACLKDVPSTGKVKTVNRKDPLLDVYKKFLSTKLHRLIVTDDAGKLQGILTRSDILRHLCLEKLAPEASKAKPA